MSGEEATPPTSETLEPHVTSVLVWETPSAIEAGQRFRLKVGIKCSGECELADSRFGVYDHEGRRVATGTLGAGRGAGTTGLYVAEVEVQAPAVEGLHTWHVRAPEADAATAHAQGSTSFGVRVVARAEHLVVVEALDKESQTPLADARVVMHPYNAMTNQRGIAEVRVAKGVYKLFVSQTGYMTIGLPLDVSADVTARAELELEPVAERN